MKTLIEITDRRLAKDRFNLYKWKIEAFNRKNLSKGKDKVIIPK